MPRRRRAITFRQAQVLTCLVGKEIEVVTHADPSISGLKGRVVLDSKNTLLIKTRDNRYRLVLKKHGVFRIHLSPGRTLIINGEIIVGTIPERIKKYAKRIKI